MQPADTTASPRRSRRWTRAVVWTIAGLLGLLLVLVASLGGGLWWTLRSEAGTQWLLSKLPGLEIRGGRGTVWGDYAADRIEFRLPNGGHVVLTDAGWRGLQVQRAPWSEYHARIVMRELHARRVDLVLPAAPQTAEPRRPPARLALPIELDIGRVQIGELHTTALGDKPLRELRARLHLGADGGTLHRVDELALAWDRLRAEGRGRIGTAEPFPLHAEVSLSQGASGAAPAWQARATLAGALASPELAATVRAEPSAERAPQSLDLRARLRPFEPWPLGDLQASTRALDLSAFHSKAPLTSLSGEATARTTARNEPATVSARLSNAEAGRWNEDRLPLRSASIELRARPDDPRTLDVLSLDAELGTQRQAAGRIQGRGQWTPDRWNVDAALGSLQPSLLDARAPELVLSGPLSVAGRSPAAGAPPDIDLTAELSGRFAARGPARNAELKLDAGGNLQRIELREARVRAGGARATASGVASRPAADAPWHLKGRAELVNFDPAPWWPGGGSSPLRRGVNRLNAKAQLDVALPAAGDMPLARRLAALRGQAGVQIARSLVAGVPLRGEAALRSAAGGVANASLSLDAAGNRLSADGRLATAGSGARDRWQLELNAPALAALAALWRLAPAASTEGALAGALNASAEVHGRWPDIATRGTLAASGLRVGATGVRSAQGRWQIDTARDAAVDAELAITELSFSQALFKGTPPIDTAHLQLKGTMRDHRLTLRADTRALPPAWTELMQAPPPGTVPGSAGPPAPRARTVGVLEMQGGAQHGRAARNAPLRWTGWRGRVQQLELRSTAPGMAPWARIRDVGIELQWAGGPTRVALQPGHAELLGAALRWERVVWQAAFGGRPAHLEAQAQLEPLPVAPLLARAQPGFGWGGDLALVGHINVRSAPTFTADIVFERQRGDLTVTDEAGKTQALGLTDLRLGLVADNGVWSFTQGLAGTTLGVAAGAVVARTTPQAMWPAPDTPIQGVLEIQVANLGTWGPWLPAGWRLTGALRTSAAIGGRFGGPEYTGEIRGSGLGVRNFLQGVNVTDGDVAIALQGASARIERFTARAGSGTATLEGNAALGESPRALLRLRADKFQLLGRVDRRIVTTGQAQLQLDKEALALDGRFSVDEALIDFSRSDAPRLSEDVQVVRGDTPPPGEAAPSANGAAAERDVKLDLHVSLGEQLRLRGRGIDTGLRGELHLTSPGGRLALNGTVSTVGGTYDAYGQELEIERGLLTFIGPIENPRLDIEATRPNTDVRVGVRVTGTALNPRVRLFSEPEMSEMDKLSWLVLGRATEGLGRTDTALLQRAALALLAGDEGGEGMTEQFTKAIGLDELSLRRTDGEVSDTVISLGKQLSRRWYVGYERGLNATAGTWQLIYRIARRFTLRAQSGEDNSLDVIWTWRWD